MVKTCIKCGKPAPLLNEILPADGVPVQLCDSHFERWANRIGRYKYDSPNFTRIWDREWDKFMALKR
jgi:hypothetical protein